MNTQKIIAAFDSHILKSGRQYYKDFYVGITNDVERRLFTEHNVHREGDWWIYACCDSESIARDVESHYLELGMRGGLGGGNGDGSAKYVYCYVVTLNTME